jgi:hypothetical protein
MMIGEEHLLDAGKLRNPRIKRQKADEMKMQPLRPMLLQNSKQIPVSLKTAFG